MREKPTRLSLNAYRTGETALQEDVLPLRKTISDEELPALQRHAARQCLLICWLTAAKASPPYAMALAAQEQFWLMDANLQSALVGLPGGDPR
jgi:hypothetical protein